MEADFSMPDTPEEKLPVVDAETVTDDTPVMEEYEEPIVDSDAIVEGEDAAAATGDQNEAEAESGAIDSFDFGADGLDFGGDSLDIGVDGLDLGADSLDLGTENLDLGSDSLDLGSDGLDLGADLKAAPAPENETPDESEPVAAPEIAEPQNEPETKTAEAAPMDFSDPHKLMTPEEIAALIAKM